RATRLMDDLLGEPARPGVEARPGVLERLATIEERLSTVAALERRIAAIERELHPNGGTSFRDAVDRLGERPRVEASGMVQAERVTGPDAEGARLAYGFTEQRSR